MRVIKKGPKWTFEIQCDDCLTLLEINEDDLQYRARDVRGFSHFYITCKNCKAMVLVKDGIPAYIQRNTVRKMKEQGRVIVPKCDNRKGQFLLPL